MALVERAVWLMRAFSPNKSPSRISVMTSSRPSVLFRAMTIQPVQMTKAEWAGSPCKNRNSPRCTFRQRLTRASDTRLAGLTVLNSGTHDR